MSDNKIRNTPRKPVVLMSMGTQERKGHDYQVMTHKYIQPLVDFSGCVPVLVPTCCGTDDLEQYLDMADGVYLTGAGSNIDPALYGQDGVESEALGPSLELAGFFANGEIGPVGGRTFVHTFSTSVGLLRRR